MTTFFVVRFFSFVFVNDVFLPLPSATTSALTVALATTGVPTVKESSLPTAKTLSKQLLHQLQHLIFQR